MRINEPFLHNGTWHWKETLNVLEVSFMQDGEELSWDIPNEAFNRRWRSAPFHVRDKGRWPWSKETVREETKEERMKRWRIAVWETVDNYKPKPAVEFQGFIGDERPLKEE